MSYTVRPISDRTWLRPAHAREQSRFTAPWTDTRDLLIREVYNLQSDGMPDPVIEVDVDERGIRIDGQLRADAKAKSPAVVVAFESIHGPLLYRCDSYVHVPGQKMSHDWQHNVRAIALTLTNLRAVDRYGATVRAEQYQGFKALPAGTGAPATGMTVAEALATIDFYADTTEPLLGQRIRLARAHAHPDRNGGVHSFWDRVDEAEQVLRRAGRLDGAQ